MKFFVMDRTGHTTLEFDAGTPAGSCDAMAKFMELVKTEKRTAATRKAGETDYKVVKNPNDIQDETLFISPMQGG